MKHQDFSHQLLPLLEQVRYQAKEEIRLEVAECMLDYGIDIKLVGAITGLKINKILPSSLAKKKAAQKE
ncbi:hypothetical protein [Halalkalibacter urbisdiaboli]|uniref:hypothetical protein n=1 Tax=Halalkalibacter urbisdiaboli TaxID=1960589 RepID=UPI000B43B03A|nr:hypothetical protein [Halalkalibacter urbisdiaboli]